jgi:hypothetical protein
LITVVGFSIYKSYYISEQKTKYIDVYKVSGWAQVGSVGNGRLMWDVAADYLRKQQHLTTLIKVNTI